MVIYIFLKCTGLVTVLLYSYTVEEFQLYAKAISKDCKFLYVALLLGQFSITGGLLIWNMGWHQARGSITYYSLLRYRFETF